MGTLLICLSLTGPIVIQLDGRVGFLSLFAMSLPYERSSVFYRIVLTWFTCCCCFFFFRDAALTDYMYILNNIWTQGSKMDFLLLTILMQWFWLIVFLHELFNIVCDGREINTWKVTLRTSTSCFPTKICCQILPYSPRVYDTVEFS